MTTSRAVKALALSVVLVGCLFADRPAKAVDTFNIYTFNGQVRFGDLASNWHVALYLRYRYPDARINFFLAHDFANSTSEWPDQPSRFEIMVPQFLADQPHQLIAAHNIHVYTGFDPGGKYPEKLESIDRNSYYIDVATLGDEACNLAFTAKAESDFPHSLPTDVLSVSDDPLLIWDWPVRNQERRLIIGDTLGNMFRRTRFVNELQRIPAFYLFYTNFFTRNLFTARDAGEMIPGTLQPIANYRGVAYARTTDYVRGYIELVRERATLDPEHTYAVTTVHPSPLNLDSAIYELLPVTGTPAPGGPLPIPIPQNQLPPGTGEGGYPNIWQAGNLTVYQYSGASHVDSVRLTKGTNLPVLVSGSLSLAHALQYMKPFIYEPASHLMPATPPIGNHVVHSDQEIEEDTRIHDDYVAQVAECNSKSEPQERNNCLEGLGEPRVPVANNACASPDVYILPDDTTEEAMRADNLETKKAARLQCLFGVFNDGQQRRYSTLLRERNESRYQQKLATYLQQRPQGMPAKHLLDLIPDYCASARGTAFEINRQCLAVKQEDRRQCIYEQLRLIRWPDEPQ